ncbi:hydrogenase [Limnochorda pilosa]|uniref:Hydrogenase n=1 Tax=Limnochorda pilosa TaxID=1555112 RepID=A0A0K2SI29_LIMPI|nr:hydrogenase [Limnochorda pilosa]
MRRALVMGLGNPLYGDDGFGVQAIAAFARRFRCEPSVAAVDGGTGGLDLLAYLEEASELVLLDAVRGPGPPGTIVELSAGELARRGGTLLSQHQVGLEEALGLALWRGRLPARAMLVGVVPGWLQLGTGLSPAVAAALPEAVDRAAAWLRRWGVQVMEVPMGEGDRGNEGSA